MAITAKPTDLNANINVLVHEAYKKGIIAQQWMAMPLMAALLERRRVTWTGGDNIMAIQDVNELNDHMQAYGEGEGLSVKRSTFLDRAYWDWKFAQLPIAYTMKEYVKKGGGYSEADLVKLLVEKSQRATRIGIYRMILGAPATDKLGTASTAYTIYSDTEGTDDSKGFQSLRHALTHGTGATTKHGHVARDYSESLAPWWESADLDGWSSTAGIQTNACEASIDTVRKAIDEVQTFVPGAKASDWIMLFGPAIHRKLKSWVEAKKIDTDKGSLAKYGFDSFTIDGVQCVKDNFLKDSVIADSDTWFFLLYLPSWEFRLHPERSYKFTDFKWQGDRAGGADEWVARILLAGNFVCHQPNANMFLTNMT